MTANRWITRLSATPPCPSLRWFGLRMLGIQLVAVTFGGFGVARFGWLAVALFSLVVAFPIVDASLSTYRDWRAYWRGERTP